MPMSPDQAGGMGVRYAYKASLIGSARQFELTEQGLSWRIGGRSGLWNYSDIATVRLSYRPVSMQARRFRTDVRTDKGGRLTIFSTTWQTAALMATQDSDYRAFIVALHQRMESAGSRAVLAGGLRPHVYAAAVACVVLLAIAMLGLLIRSIATGEWAGVLFLLGFAALFAWQVGGFIARNRPFHHAYDKLPKALLP